LPVADDIYLVDGRYQRLVDGEFVHPGYKSEAHRRRSEVIGNLILAALPLGLGARAAHVAVKQARWVPRAKVHQSTVRVAGQRGRPWVSSADYASRPGLPTKSWVKYRDFRALKASASKEIGDLPIIGRVVRLRSRVSFLRDPVTWTAKRIPLVGGYVIAKENWNRFNRLIDYINSGLDNDGEPPYRPPFEQTPVQLPGTSSKSLVSSTHKKPHFPKGRCPPGHRWDSRVGKCVRSRRRR